jgi:hypothetical protein
LSIASSSDRPRTRSVHGLKMRLSGGAREERRPPSGRSSIVMDPGCEGRRDLQASSSVEVEVLCVGAARRSSCLKPIL